MGSCHCFENKNEDGDVWLYRRIRNIALQVPCYECRMREALRHKRRDTVRQSR